MCTWNIYSVLSCNKCLVNIHDLFLHGKYVQEIYNKFFYQINQHTFGSFPKTSETRYQCERLLYIEIVYAEYSTWRPLCGTWRHPTVTNFSKKNKLAKFCNARLYSRFQKTTDH